MELTNNPYYMETDEQRDCLNSIAGKCIQLFVNNQLTTCEIQTVLRYIQEVIGYSEAVNVFKYDGQLFQKKQEQNKIDSINFASKAEANDFFCKYDKIIKSVFRPSVDDSDISEEDELAL